MTAGVAVAIATLASNALGFVRELVLARAFGASRPLDAYLSALSLTNVVTLLLLGGTLHNALLPVFSSYIHDPGREMEGWELAAQFLAWCFGGMGLVAGLIVLLAEPIIRVLAGGFDLETQQLAANLLRLLAVSLPFSVSAGIFASLLNAHKRFALPSLIAVLHNLVLVGCVVLLAGRWGIYAPALGMMLGTIAQCVLQGPSLWRLWPRASQIRLWPLHPGMEGIVRLGVPAFGVLVVNQLSSLVQNRLASQMNAGAISALGFAAKIYGLPLGIIAGAFGTVLFPFLAEQFTRRDTAQIRDTLMRSLRVIAFSLAPVGVCLIALATPIVRVTLERGAFTLENSLITANVLRMYAVGIVFQGAIVLLLRAFYAIQDGQTPLRVGILVETFQIGALLFLRTYGVSGLALATSIQSAIYALVLSALLFRGLGRPTWGEMGSPILRILLASLVMGGACYAFQVTTAQMSVWFQVVASAGSGLFAYLLAARLFNVTELQDIWRILTTRIRPGLAKSAGS